MKKLQILYILLAGVFVLSPIFANASSINSATSEHKFSGVWITTPEFENLQKTNVFHRQLDKVSAKKVGKLAEKIQNRHILFRKEFSLENIPQNAELFFSADDYAKIYINGKFVAQGPAPSYHFHYLYHKVDVSKFLRKGKNVIAVHTYYQGFINRAWVSGDYRHGFICDITDGENVILKSGEDWKYAPHTGFTSAGVIGYNTQFAERYNAGAPEVLFETPNFDDSYWQCARMLKQNDYTLAPSSLPLLELENIEPKEIKNIGKNKIFIDFGKMYVGYFSMSAKGKKGDIIETRFAQELNDDGSVRFKLRANCTYQEYFVMSGKTDTLNQFDYKSFRYTELILPDGVEVDVSSIKLIARHMPFELEAKNKFAGDKKAEAVWNLCVRSLQYGVQEQIQDCMDREKGYYLGDGVYTTLTYALLTKNYAPVRKLIDDFLRTSFINGGLVTCANCSFMQEIAEYPLMMFILAPILAEREQDKEFIRARMGKLRDVLDFYKKSYAQENGLLTNLDKWCVVEWPMNWRDGYDVDITQGKVCKTTHNVINAWYIGAIKAYNKAARILGELEYPNERELTQAFYDAFYDKNKKLFKDSVETSHISFPANVYPYFMGLYPNEECRKNIVKMIDKYRLTKVMLFASFPTIAGLARDGEERLVYELLTDDRTWHAMLTDGATATFEGWYKSAKWNTSLFHLALTYAAAFMVEDANLDKKLDLRNK